MKVIHALTGTHFSEQELFWAANDHDYVITNSKGDFYDTSKAPWPIKKTIVSDDPQSGNVDVPLAEDELLQSTLTRYRCIFIKTCYINTTGIQEHMESSQVCTHDYKSVVIKSTHAPSDHYNFYDHPI